MSRIGHPLKQLWCASFALSLASAGCGSSAPDGGVPQDTGNQSTDSGTADTGTADGGIEMGMDAGSNPGPDVGIDAGPNNDAGPQLDMGAGPGPIAPVYSGVCPDFTEGRNQNFMSGGASREFLLELPAQPTGAPVIFLWHWLGGSAQQIMTGLGGSGLADTNEVIIIAPDSFQSQFEWRFTQGPANNIDIQLFEDLLACLSEQFSVDLNRIHSTGHSAGGLWTSYLTMHESQYLASTVVFSGGSDQASYVTPSRQLPVLVVWGGPTDTFSGFNFETSSQLFSQLLRNDGHFVAHCVHAGGHVPPPNAASLLIDWFQAHPYNLGNEPYAGGLPAVYPANQCSIP